MLKVVNGTIGSPVAGSNVHGCNISTAWIRGKGVNRTQEAAVEMIGRHKSLQRLDTLYCYRSDLN
jgi:hypothetical protein